MILTVNAWYSRKILEYNNYQVLATRGTLHQVKGFDAYNQLIDLNAILSSNPNFDPIDRSRLALGPFNFTIGRPWQVPKQPLSLETALQQRVQSICNQNHKINLLWSGGIDSTTFVVAFMMYATNLEQLRIIYSPWSIYEHPDFFKKLQQFSKLELLDISGDVYLGQLPDGIYVSGNSGDETHASLDSSFIEYHGYDALRQSWQNFFRRQGCSDRLLEFCEQFFNRSGREIQTVLDARWWFYLCCKQTGILHSLNLPLFSMQSDFDPNRLLGFFDCYEYENFIWYNVDKILPQNHYRTWRQFLKDFCFAWDGIEDWRKNKCKTHSKQLAIYQSRRQILHDQRHLMIRQSGEIVATPNLPFLSQQEWLAVKPQVPDAFRAAV